ncbi:uncharacterized protein [Acropora muricata]|uniref:uncharacterized protein isoform X3 n=1 Tax=Acropora muricata TaxID=159855 RepID=UPI0034E3D68A
MSCNLFTNFLVEKQACECGSYARSNTYCLSYLSVLTSSTNLFAQSDRVQEFLLSVFATFKWPLVSSNMIHFSWLRNFEFFILMYGYLQLKCQGTFIMTHGKCVCHGPNGTYNLQPLQRTDNNPRFQTSGRRHYEYFYNPCTSFLKTNDEEDEGCTFDVAVCYGAQGVGPYVKLGNQSSAECKTDAETGRTELMYKTAEYPGPENAVRIRLICDWKRKIPKFQKTIVKGIPWNYFGHRW